MLLAQPEAYSHPELKWRTITTPHFTVTYHEGAERSAALTAKIAEEIYGPITALYDLAPTRVDIVIKDTDDYSNGGAYFFENKIEIWASALEFHLRGQHDWLRNVITHEFTHIVTLNSAFKYGRLVPALYFQVFGYEQVRRPDVLYGFPNVLVSYPIAGLNVPFWLAEGVAQYQRKELSYEAWDSHRDMILRSAVLDDRIWNLDEISNLLVKSGFGAEYGYNFGYAFTRYLAERFGELKLRALVKQFSSMSTLNVHHALEATYHLPSTTLYNDWVNYLKSNYGLALKPIFEREIKGKRIHELGTNFFPIPSLTHDTLFFISNFGAEFGGYGIASMPLMADSGKGRLSTTSRDMAPRTVHALFSKGQHDNTSHDNRGLAPQQRCRFCGMTSFNESESLVKGTNSRLWLSADGSRLFYSKYVGTDFEIPRYNDLFYYDLKEQKEVRLSRAARVESPVLSPDGTTLLAVHQKDGTMNLVEATVPPENQLLVESSLRVITPYKNGEQVYLPAYHPSGKFIVFALGIRNTRRLMKLNRETGEVEPLMRWGTPLQPDHDERDPHFSKDGSRLLFASNVSGIFNIYEYHLETQQLNPITNVTGGAFMPSYGRDQEVFYAEFTSTGHKIASIRPDLNRLSDGMLPYRPQMLPIERDTSASDNVGIDSAVLTALREYDDLNPMSPESKEYRKIFTPPIVLPVVRFDAYAKTKGTVLADAWRAAKFGVAFNSAEALGNLNLSGLFTIAPGSSVSGGNDGIAGILELERDAFLSLEYNDKTFLPSSMMPRFQLDIFHLTRNIPDGAQIGGFQSESSPLDSATANVFFGLTQYELSTRFRIPIQSLFFQASSFRLSFALSPFSSKVGSFFWEPLGQRITASSDTYFIGRTGSLIWNLDLRPRSMTSSINPIGLLTRFRVDYEDSKLQRSIEFNEATGTIRPVYQDYRFFRITTDINVHLPLPTWSTLFNHTLSLRTYAAVNLSAETDFFFQNFISGLLGMRGYEFYAVGGDKAGFVHLEYRFPLAQHLDLQFFQFYFDRLYFSTFFDIGVAWNGSGWPQANQWRRDVGVELRLEAPSFYLFPTRLFVSATYGIDRFTEPVRAGFFTQDGSTVINYGGEWRFHFGVLFDFDFMSERSGALRYF